MNFRRVFHKRRVVFAFFSACFVALLVIRALNNNLPLRRSARQQNDRQNGQQENIPTHRSVAPINFDIRGQDVIVFLHMQKTGGSVFGKHLVFDLNLERPCVCHNESTLRCSCKRPGTNSMWLFSRYSIGWPCGTHTGWTQLMPCVPRILDNKEGKSPTRRFLYITIIRDPVTRIMSEYRHHQRGAIWKGERPFCDGRMATEEEFPRPPCRGYSADEWAKISLEKFINCEKNPARNRQTHMLADLTLVNCYNVTGMSTAERDRIMLASAKQNLESMTYFALTEYQAESQFLFEKTFGLTFVGPFQQRGSTGSIETAMGLDEKTMRRIAEVNALDIALYKYAYELFWRRVDFFNIDINKR